MCDGRRVSDWIKLHCGDLVFDLDDERHIGKVESVFAGVLAKVRWLDTNWISFIPVKRLQKI